MMKKREARRASVILTAPVAIGTIGVAALAEPCEWQAIGEGVGQMVHAVQTFDDGTGPALYAAVSGNGIVR